jgi:hypothetical protein
MFTFLLGLAIGWYFFPQPETGKETVESIRKMLNGDNTPPSVK